jgi:anti-sigma factor ChrR (cupin superfamily)
MDFSQYLIINTDEMEWIPSPAGGVLRKPLARAEQERGHATSIVRYEKGAKFNSHPHPLGEEILVLEGIFSDEAGDYGPGSYIRNPPGSQHAPFSQEGCVILVKLHQFAADDKQQLVIDTKKQNWVNLGEGTQIIPLHHHGNEEVCLLELSVGVELVNDGSKGTELFIIEGKLRSGEETYLPRTWLRNGSKQIKRIKAEQDSVIWLKTGHLATV